MKANIFLTKIILTLLVIISASCLYADCKLMGLIGLNGKNLSNPETWENFTWDCIDKLKFMGQSGADVVYPNDNPNGWSLLTYEGESPTHSFLFRNQPGNNAYDDNLYNNVTEIIKTTREPRILLGHIRKATNQNTLNLPDPHPFIFDWNDKEYTFMHNGSVNYEHIRDNLMDQDWLSLNPIPEYSNEIIDSEVFFYWIMQNIEEQDGDILKGLKIALSDLTDDYRHTCLNFILSDGIDLYAYRYMYSDDSEHELAYFYDTLNEYNNHFYCGVMSIFPNGEEINNHVLADWTNGTDTPDNIHTHAFEKDELIYISSNGNIVRLPHFAAGNVSLSSYSQKRDFHQGCNWTGFPILPINIVSQSVAVSPLLNYYLNPNNGGLQNIDDGSYTCNSIYPTLPYWEPIDYQLSMPKLYKIEFLQDSPSIHTTNSTNAHNITLFDSSIYPAGAYVLDNVEADQEYWISYTLLPSQNIQDAFGDSWGNVASIQAEKWYYEKQINNQGKSEPIEDPIDTYTIDGKNVDFGKGYIVKFIENQDYFAWYRPYLPEPVTPERQEPEFFEWEDAPEYLVIDIVQAEEEPEILEIGAFQGENCIGAVAPDKFPCQLLIYPKYDDPNPITFQIIYNAKHTPQFCSNYQVYQPNLSIYAEDMIIPAKKTNYIVKLTEDTPSQNVSSLKALLSVSNYPNPFNPKTTISFALKYKADVHVSVYNIKGQMVKDFGKQVYNSGIHRLNWNGKDNQNHPASGGIYFVRINAGTNILTHKIVMLK